MVEKRCPIHMVTATWVAQTRDILFHEQARSTCQEKNKRLDNGSVAGVGSNFAHPDFRGCTYNEKCGPILRAPTGDALRRLQQMLHEDMHPPAADAQKGCVEYRFASATLIPHPLQLACILTCSLSCSRIGSPVSASAWGVCWRRSRVCY
jgi:hypothetical protein